MRYSRILGLTFALAFLAACDSPVAPVTPTPSVQDHRAPTYLRSPDGRLTEVDYSLAAATDCKIEAYVFPRGVGPQPVGYAVISGHAYGPCGGSWINWTTVRSFSYYPGEWVPTEILVKDASGIVARTQNRSFSFWNRNLPATNYKVELRFDCALGKGNCPRP